VINTPSAYQANALKWAIFNTQCIELLDSKEHAATVANLCMRFRLASTKKNTIGFITSYQLFRWN
jgi:hypothetical protein